VSRGRGVRLRKRDGAIELHRTLPNGSRDRERKNKQDQQPPEPEMPPYRRRRYFPGQGRRDGLPLAIG
jgi:hypothetical protein